MTSPDRSRYPAIEDRKTTTFIQLKKKNDHMKVPASPFAVLLLVFVACVFIAGCVMDAPRTSSSDTSTTASGTPPETRSPDSTILEDPNPSFVNPRVTHERRFQAASGVITGAYQGKDIINLGGSGDLYLEVHADDITYSKVFYADRGETVTAWIRFSKLLPASEWTVRAATGGDRDTEDRVVVIERLPSVNRTGV